jgi:hypothetical protein
VCDWPCDIILTELQNSSFVVPILKCVNADNVCNQEVFQISFPQFVQEAKYEKSVHGWWKKNLVLNKYFVFKKHTALPVIQFSKCDSIHISSLYDLIPDFMCSQWWGFIMQSGLGHLVVWYMVMNVLKEYPGSVFTDSQKMEAVCLDWNLRTHQSCYTVP